MNQKNPESLSDAKRTSAAPTAHLTSQPEASSLSSPGASSLSSYVRTLARGPGRSRNLTQEEAFDAFSLILTGEAPKEAVGAILMLMRYRSENAEELTGIIKACHAHLPSWFSAQKVDLDWPTYAAGRTRGLPYFLLSALALSKSGITIFMHGFNSQHPSKASTQDALEALGIPICQTQEQIEKNIKAQNFAYMPLRTMSPVLYDLINLREILGLRSPVNTVLRGLNPTSASGGLIGVFHPNYIPLQAGAATLLNNGNALILKGGGGEAERTPYKPIKAIYCHDGKEVEIVFPAIRQKSKLKADKEASGEAGLDHLKATWLGEVNNKGDEAVILATISIALYCLEKASSPGEADKAAKDIWHNRHQ